jgi:hypothetical protein
MTKKIITDLKDFDPKTTEIIDGDAFFFELPSITYLGVLLEITGDAYFPNSQVKDLGNLQTIRGYADFPYSQVQSLGNLQTIGGEIYWGNRTDLQAEWEVLRKNK